MDGGSRPEFGSTAALEPVACTTSSAKFFLRQGFTPNAAAEPLSFSQWLDGFPGGPVPLPGETFFYRILTTDSGPVSSQLGALHF
ncbi:hypothetical protein [Nocardia fluminea]|uniref:hypothetical protein n=1 Tax=Nocardia fluminea TaxID=134984 RepID=UPI003D112F01